MHRHSEFSSFGARAVHFTWLPELHRFRAGDNGVVKVVLRSYRRGKLIARRFHGRFGNEDILAEKLFCEWHVALGLRVVRRLVFGGDGVRAWLHRLRDVLSLSDAVEMVSFLPSCNTVEGVSQLSECLGGKPTTRNESKGDLGSLRCEDVVRRVCSIVRLGCACADRFEIQFICGCPKDSELCVYRAKS